MFRARDPAGQRGADADPVLELPGVRGTRRNSGQALFGPRPAQMGQASGQDLHPKELQKAEKGLHRLVFKARLGPDAWISCTCTMAVQQKASGGRVRQVPASDASYIAPDLGEKCLGGVKYLGLLWPQSLWRSSHASPWGIIAAATRIRSTSRSIPMPLGLGASRSLRRGDGLETRASPGAAPRGAHGGGPGEAR